MSDSTTNESRPPPGRNYEALKLHIITHKIDCGLWLLRVLAVLFAFLYFIPILGNAQNYYYKVLIANAAISAFRLHQRIGGVQFTREFLAQVISEDSFHYLFYSLIFLYGSPFPLVILPVVLFSTLHAASYSLTLLDTMGQNSWWGARFLISLVEFQSLNILRLVAFSEIILMPCTIFLILMGRVGLLTPFTYYQFLIQRYASRRNPYTRNMFRELRLLFDSMAAKSTTPGFVKQILSGIVNFTCKLAPVQQMGAQQQSQ